MRQSASLPGTDRVKIKNTKMSHSSNIYKRFFKNKMIKLGLLVWCIKLIILILFDIIELLIHILIIFVSITIN